MVYQEEIFVDLLTLKFGLACPEASVRIYYSTLRKIPNKQESHLHRGKSLKSQIYTFFPFFVRN
jgi:hypothetical protein